VLPCKAESAQPLVTDERIKLLSFTGSPQVGWAMKARAGKKKVVLELGGNAACIVDEGCDVAVVADRLIIGAFYQSGQSCISVQRILAHESLYDSLCTALCERAKTLVSGDPLDEKDISWAADFAGGCGADRAMGERGGARRSEGCLRRKRNGAFYDATILENVDPKMKVSCVEVFGPVATLQPFADFNEAIRVANDSTFGLQAGVFTNNLHHAWQAFDELEVGGVIINDIPAFA